MGKTLRRLHDGGVWHRDVSVGNLLVRYEGRERREPTIYLVDLNRARVGSRLTTGRRTRDLCRLRIFDPDHQEIFLRSYWGQDDRGFASKRLLYRIFFRGFLTKVWIKDSIRAPFRSLLAAVKPRHGHVHLQPAPADTSKRDKVVWDPLSDQPHQHAGRLEKTLGPCGRSGNSWRPGLGGGQPSAADPPPLSRAEGGSLSPTPPLGRSRCRCATLGSETPKVCWPPSRELGAQNILLRLHPWQQDHTAEEALARDLAQGGCDLTFALPQNRDMVRGSGPLADGDRRDRRALHSLWSPLSGGPGDKPEQVGRVEPAGVPVPGDFGKRGSAPARRGWSSWARR